jgi:long-chain acyl-CoA synthetase
MLSHNNVVSNVKAVRPILPVNNTHRSLSFLPLCHIFERVVFFFYSYVGVSIYYAESIEALGDNLKEVKPHFFSCVPRLLEKVYGKIVAKGHDLTGIKKKLFFWAHDLGMRWDENNNNGIWYNIQLAIANKLIFSKWREALGGQVVGIVTGAAALQPRLCRVFNAAGIQVREGYGQTETSPVVSFNRFEKGGCMVGSIGKILPGVEVKLSEKDNEIMVKGPNVMMGYYNRPDLTAEVLSADGWLRTGDVGQWVDGTFLKITDRLKELFKTSGGKYVAPQVIENIIKEHYLVEQVMVVGSDRNFVSALIVPNYINLEAYCKSNGLGHSTKKIMASHEVVKRIYDEMIVKTNVNFGKWEQVKKYELMQDEWSIEGGELTPTMKVKRKVILDKYKPIVDKIYADSEFLDKEITIGG